MKPGHRLLRTGLIIIALLLIWDVIQHPSGSGNTACYPQLTCYHHTTHAPKAHVTGGRSG